LPSVRRWLPFSLNVAIGRSDGFGPALAHGRYELFFVLSHLPDKRLIGRIFVCGRPEHHFREDWREIDSLWGKRVNQLAAIRGVGLGGDDSMSDQLLQPVRQNIRRDFLVGTQELFIRAETPQHHVANNQQRPAIAQYLHGSIQGTSGAAPWAWIPVRHIERLAFVTCILQVTCCRLIFPSLRS